MKWWWLLLIIKEMKYYKIGSPSYWEVVYEDLLFYYILAKNRSSKTLDVVNKNEAFDTKEEFIKFVSDEYNRQIENYKKQIKWAEERIVYETNKIQWVDKQK